MVKLEIIHKQLTRNKRKTFFGWLKIQTSPAVKKDAFLIFDLEPKLWHSAIFLPPQKGQKLPLWEPISLVWKKNLIIAAMAPSLIFYGHEVSLAALWAHGM